ncbi:hypothetical protein KDW_55640 [Dictyobacter vulcani]|uniref:Uncharacterized protein n=1 Tax=Dictyobacter vulcani TaxID=2607529 RepID=A0A5J4KW83_9CHLR|nr:hypothetical protein KDW_55640 [Dictyobacter vulcani]
MSMDIFYVDTSKGVIYVYSDGLQHHTNGKVLKELPFIAASGVIAASKSGVMGDRKVWRSHRGIEC